MNDLAFATIVDLRRLLRAGRVSAAEVARDTLARLSTVGRHLNAIAELTPHRAEREAGAADRRLRQGDAGPLVGIPYGAKDLLATAGIPTRWGSPAYRNQTFDTDATVITRLRGASAVLTAKLAMVELAGAGMYRRTDASLHGPGRNPWDPERWSGGSSSGSAIAVAAGLVPFSLGSETGASLVLPAAFCGVTALRPSFGAVSRAGAMSLAWSTDRIGPIAHTAADCAVVLAAIAGRDERDATTVDRRFGRPPPHRSLRIGVLEAGLTDNPETARVFEKALRTLRRLGHKVRRATLPEFDYSTLYDLIAGAETAATHEGLIRSPLLGELVDPAQRAALRELLGRALTPYVRAAEQRIALTRAVRDLFHDVDVLTAPTALIEAVPLDADLGLYRARRRGGNTHMGALVGLPELTMPMGFGPAGMPLGLSLIGDLFSDGALLRAAIDYQRETGWHTLRPPMATPPVGVST